MVRKAYSLIDLLVDWLYAVIVFILVVIVAIVFIVKTNNFDSKIKETCTSSFSNATSRDSLTIIENEPRCAAYIKDE